MAIFLSVSSTIEFLHPKDQSISSLGKIPIEIMPGKGHITWVLAVFLCTTEFQMEPPVPNAISYDTRPTTY